MLSKIYITLNEDVFSEPITSAILIYNALWFNHIEAEKLLKVS